MVRKLSLLGCIALSSALVAGCESSRARTQPSYQMQPSYRMQPQVQPGSPGPPGAQQQMPSSGPSSSQQSPPSQQLGPSSYGTGGSPAAGSDHY